ncbi:MAG: LysM peptidoglycan-binding domain-containing protein [Desulfobacteraceae bacterium]|nr:MAG: LysM peptidoglycan-binding domain-containing protein [Desulfobacteraceae bacterium]
MIYRITTCLILAVLFCFNSLHAAGPTTVPRNDQAADSSITLIPSLVDSIQFKEDILFCDIRIPVNDPQIKQRLEKELMLSLWDRPQVILWLKRSTRYFPQIEKILKKNNLHSDFKYVPVVESALRPHSRSNKGAVGFWQFIRSTGKRYQLRIDSKIDERRNIIKSTHAACLYLKKLQDQFGSSLLALAAYNMGEYGLASEIKAQEIKDFFSLYLPLETQRYILKIIAAKMIIEHPERYGFYLKKQDYYPELSFDRVNFNSKTEIPITLIAKAAKTSFKTIKDLNPDIRGYYLTTGKISILIPKGQANNFEKRFSKLFSQYRKTHEKRFHIVKKGESLTGIARQYKISLSTLLKWNNLNRNSMIHPGNRLVVSKN